MDKTRYYEDYGSHGTLQEESMQEAAESQLIAVEKAMILSEEAREAINEAADLAEERQEQSQHRIQEINGHDKHHKEIPLEETLEILKKDFEILQENFVKFFEKCQEFLVEASILLDLERMAEKKQE